MSERTLLFSDVVASTELVRRLGDVAAAQLWASHDRRARDLMMLHRGREIDRTDGFFLLFDEAADAACYALGYHRVLSELQISGRVGIHVGDVTLRENTPEDIGRGAKPIEVEGLSKPLAARVMALSQGGQTLISASAQEALAGALPTGSKIWKHGYYRLKGIEEPVELFEIGTDDSSFSPPADSDKGYRVVRTDDLWRPVRKVRHNLPVERDAFIGRGTELRALAARLDVGVRLLTILGAAGTGKTRFVRRYGLTCLGDWPGGVYFCDLSEAQTLDGILFAVASALEVRLSPDNPAVGLGHVIAARGRCLVVLDNFEQVVEHASATVGLWLDRPAAATFVVTSRELLHLPGEEIFPIEPLSLKTEAIELFVERARAQDPKFALGPGNRSAVAEIVRMLDGLPLAIELAAARIRLLSPAQLVQRMRDRFHLLVGKKGAAARQATLRAAIDWSWELLPVFEQSAFAQCAVFEGGFTLEAAEAVLDLTLWPDACSATDVVQALVDKSLLRTWVPVEQRRYGIEETYFGMYISIHEYAVEKLHDSAQDAGRRAEERHGEYFATFGTDNAIDALSLHGGAQRRRALALELDNLVSACRRALNRGDVGTACAAYRAIWEVVELHGPYALCAELGWQLVGLSEEMSAPLRVTASWTLAQALRRAGRLEEARPLLVQALTLARDTGDLHREGSVLSSLGGVYRQLGRMADSRASFEAALAASRRTKDRRLEGLVLSGLAVQRLDDGLLDAARSDLEAALTITREVGDRRVEGMVARSLAATWLQQGNESAGSQNLEVARSIAIELGDLWLQSLVVGTFGGMNTLNGHTEEGLTQVNAALAMSRELGDRSGEFRGLATLADVHRRQGRKGESEEHFAAAIALANEIGNPSFQAYIHCSFGDLRRDQGLWEEARGEYEASLAVGRAVNDRAGEAAALSKLGALLVEQRQLAEAGPLYRQALALARDTNQRVLEGEVLGNLGNLLAKEGQLPEAIEALQTGEALLRSAVNREGLAKILCIRGRANVSVGERSSAHAALVEAEALSTMLHNAPDTELGRGIALLREVLA